MKQQRHTAIQELLVKTAVASQDDLRRKLAGRGFHVTQATLPTAHFMFISQRRLDFALYNTER